MSVHNGGAYLYHSIFSILEQTLNDFEFIIIDDGSDDGTFEILQSFTDTRIIIHRNVNNRGLTASLNIGLEIARGYYIARQDADDISCPQRLEKQVTYLQAHPETAMLGSGARIIDYKGIAGEIISFPVNPFLLRWQLLFDNRIVHSSTIFRSEIIKSLGGYNERMKLSQDFELWGRIALSHTIAQLEEPLILLRIHKDSISSVHLREQELSAVGVVHRNLKALIKDDLPDEVIHCLRAVFAKRFHDTSPSMLISTANILNNVYCIVLTLWKPNAEGLNLLRQDYLARVLFLAQWNLDFGHRGTLRILAHAASVSKSGWFSMLITKMLLKMAIGICHPTSSVRSK